MSDIHDLYQQLIIDHGRRPRNFSALPEANCVLEGFNPLCGDRLTVYVVEKDGKVAAASFLGTGCAISVASGSLMMEAIQGKTLQEVHDLFSSFHQLLTGGNAVVDLGKLSALAGVAEFPARVKCATLAWHTLIAAISHESKIVSTES